MKHPILNDPIFHNEEAAYSFVESHLWPNVFVNAPSKTEAQREAAKLLMKKSWLVTYWRLALRITPVRFRKLDKQTREDCLFTEKFSIPVFARKKVIYH